MADGFVIEFEFRDQRYQDAALGLKALQRELNLDWDGQVKTLSTELKSFLGSVIDALRSRHGNAYPGGTSANSLSVRSGKFIAGLKDAVTVSGQTFETLQGSIAIPFPGVVHEFGATIKAKGKLLTIPLPAAMDSRGVPLKPKARDWDKTFVAKTKAGNLVIFRRDGTKVVPLYVLKDKVVIPPRLNARATLQAGLPYFVDRAMDAMVRDMAKKLGG